MLVRAAINIVLSVALGVSLGVFGILLATAISLIVTSFWYEPSVLFSRVFNVPVSEYWIKQAKYFGAACVGLFLSYFAVLPMANGILWLVLKAVIVVMIVSALFAIAACQSVEFKTAMRILKIRRK